MAIIYTYPIKQKPVAADLVVITDSEDKNFTKQCSIQSIIELFDCDLCTFCTTSISKIATPSGEAVESITCGEEISFTSSDASVSIIGNNATKTIDFKAGGSDGCPTTYIIKPVQCDKETGDCVIVPKQETWFYSSDCFFADYAPGYIKDFNVNGLAYGPDGPPGETPFTCYYVEEAVFTATASDCASCCDGPTDPIIKFTPCVDGPEIIETAQSNVIGWDPIYLDNPCEFLNINDPFGEPIDCWKASLGTLDSGSIVTINSSTTFAEPCSCECCENPCSFELTPCDGEVPPAFDPVIGAVVQPSSWPTTQPCEFSGGETVAITFLGETWCFTLTSVCQDATFSLEMTLVPDCLSKECGGGPGPENYKWTKCSDPLVSFAEEFDPEVPLGTIRRYCCDPGVEPDECYEYAGPTIDLPSPPPCPTPIGVDEPDCACCDYPCNYQYTACPGEAPKGTPATIIVDAGKAKDGCTCNEPLGTIYINVDPENTWCYTDPERVCLEKTHSFEGEAECGGEFCAEAPIERFFRYQTCVGEAEDLFTSDLLNPGIESLTLPFIGTVGNNLSCPPEGIDPELCCINIIEEILEEPLLKTAISASCWDTAYININEDCPCCVNQNSHEYIKCESKACLIPAEFDIITLDACAEFGITKASGASVPDVIQVTIGDDTCCYEATNWNCLQPEKVDAVVTFDGACEECVNNLRNFKLTDCFSGAEVITSDDLSAQLGSTWLMDDGNCYTVSIYVGPTSAPLALSFVTPYDDDDACDCCRFRDTIEYEKCPGVEGEACDGMPLKVYLDGNTVPGGPGAGAATNITIASIADPTLECCYVKVDTPPCVVPDTAYQYKSEFENCETLPEVCLTAEEAPKMLISGQDGVQDGTSPIEVPNPIGEFPPYINGEEGDSWFSVQIPEEAVLPENIQWSTLYATEGFYVGETPLRSVGNQAGAAFLPAFNADFIGNIIPGAVYQLTANADFIIDPSVVEGMEGNIVFFTGPGEEFVEKKSAIAEPEGGKKTIYEESLEDEAAKKASGPEPKE